MSAFDLFVVQLNEDTNTHSDVSYMSYLLMLEEIENKTLNEFSLPVSLKKAKQFISDFIVNTGMKAVEVIQVLKEKTVFRFFDAVDWSMKKIHKLLSDGYKIAKYLKIEVAHFVTALGKKEASTFDKWIEDKPIRKKLMGIGVASLLAYIWFNMTFTGDPEYDFNQTDLINALHGDFSISDLFTGHSGVKLLSLFTAGSTLGISFPWPGGATAQFTIAIITSLSTLAHGKLSKKFRDRKARKKSSIKESDMKYNKFNSLLNEAISSAISNAYEKTKVNSDKTCSKCDYVYPKYKGRYPTKCPNCEDGSTSSMKNAMMKTANVKATCSCGFVVPKYKGKYPKYCASCGRNMIY